MDKTSFHIKGMCCADEIAVLKAAVAPLAGDENLSFDLLQAKMIVEGKLDSETSERIIAAVAKTGMQASLSGASLPETGRMFELNGRVVACAGSGILALGAMALEALGRGSILEMLAESGGAAVTPAAAIGLYIAAIVSGGWFIFPKALYAARRFRPDMNFLMTVAVAGAIALGQWLEAASVSFLFALALLLESWSIGRAKREISALLDITPATARTICPGDGDLEELPVGQVPVGSTVVVHPGERIPLDGVVTRGVTTINQAPITGESAGVLKSPGSDVFAGTINEEGTIQFRSTRPASDTTLSTIIRMIEEGRSRRAPAEQWVEKFARGYTPVMMIVALLIAVVPPLAGGGDWARWVYGGLVVLVIACPCALVISTPVTVVAGLSSAARNGILIKGGAYLEAPAHLRAIAFDKTGTLTRGCPEVKEIIPLGDHGEEDLVAHAAALEAHSAHPFARAILQHAAERGIGRSVAESFSVIPGEGAEGVIGGRDYWIGSHRMLERRGDASAPVQERIRALKEAGGSIVLMGCGREVCGILSLADTVREGAAEVISDLRSLGLRKITMITGDNRKTAEMAARAAGIDEFHSELLPGDKVRLVEELGRKNGGVAMVGDGINDAPAMTAATVGIAMGAMGTDAAIETADIALMADDLRKIPWLIGHSKKTLRVIRQSIVFALLVKITFFALAAGGIATLWGAIAADMGASLLVIMNGLRLLNTGETPGSTDYPALCRSELACRCNPRL
ncbi:MAG: heavy metal translocating P-type ATPase [Desulfobacteraceae bacterium]|nr:heavy metal translocating P-type ATPase [Desulfobacteraceae bacterium]